MSTGNGWRMGQEKGKEGAGEWGKEEVGEWEENDEDRIGKQYGDT